MRFAAGLVAAVALALGGVAHAQAPEKPVKLSLSYDGRLYVKVLDMRFDETAGSGSFDAAANLRSYGILALFNHFDIKASARGPIEDGAPRPGTFLYENQDGERVRKVKVDWRPGEVVAVSNPKYGDLGHPPASLEQKLASADPITQIMRISLALGPDKVCGGSPLFFDGKQLYQLEFDTGQTVQPNAGQRALGLTSVVRCPVAFREVAGFKPPKRHKQGLKSRIDAIFGQLGPDGPWVIVKVTASTLLGPAVIELTHVAPAHEARLARE
jgi:hypothetical protein